MTEVADNTLVDGRYRIVARIGSGGMADVYRAEDTHLGREVALKILHRRFAQDYEFVERFRREASSAAGLQHPNVVAVFDRGEHDGTYYIAMECLSGRTLKELIQSEAPLSEERSIDLGLQILRAASFAHRRGVIHRDFKSQNVIVDEDGNAKVTDFGIARAGTSEITETGSIMGTAQYLSPEQAEGHAVNETSDLYSIGVIVYELLAGRLPFEGDSAVSVALKHLSQPPPPLSHFRPDVHPSLEAVVMRALAKDPSQRYSSAEEFAVALDAARADIESGADGVQSTAAFVPVPAPVAPPDAEALAPTAATVIAEPAAGEAGPPPPYPPPPGDEPGPEKRRRRWPLFTIGLMALALAALLAFLAISGLLAADRVDVPRVVGKQLVQARAALERAGFEVKETRVRSLAEFDRVIDQDPNPGQDADEGSTVTLEVSNGPGTVRVPSVERLPQERAIKELNKVGLKVNLDTVPSDTVEQGFAIRTVPREGQPVERGTRVRLFVSSGPERVPVPDVVGLSRESAEAELRAQGLGVAVQEQESDEREDVVIGQDPGAGTRVRRGQRVTITVSVGRVKVDVPNVVGLSAADAVRQLRAEGLGAARRERRVTDEEDDGVVVDQRPGPGADVDSGRQVVIIVGRFEPDEEEAVPPAEPPAP
jgi:beta-lactam-binding protein with PASTA domain/tRNA A-37 threonylcarbamoyl transferase component Bud32